MSPSPHDRGDEQSGFELELDAVAVAESAARVQRPRPRAKNAATLMRRREMHFPAERNVRAVGAILMMQGVGMLIAPWAAEGQRGVSTPALVGQSAVALLALVIAGNLRRLRPWARWAAVAGLTFWLLTRVVQLATRGLEGVLEQSIALGLGSFSLYILLEKRSAPVFEADYRDRVIPNTKEFKAGGMLGRIGLGLAVGLALLYALLIMFREHLG